jgi:hypothetical protein
MQEYQKIGFWNKQLFNLIFESKIRSMKLMQASILLQMVMVLITD